MNTFKKFPIRYSLKNIPLPNKLEYQKTLTSMVEKFLVRCRWKIFWYKNLDKKKEEMNNFGFKSTKYPSTDKDIKEFEDELMEMIGSVEMRFYSNTLQNH